MKILLTAVATCFLLACVSGKSVADADQAGFELVLIRHAEKLDASSDPELSPAGQLRAAWTADWLQNRDIGAVWSSDYNRSRNTARPLAEKLGQEIRIYDPRDLPALAVQLQSEGLNALVVGHSNTTPQLAAILCECETEPMEETEYDRAFLLSAEGPGFELKVLNQKVLRESTPGAD